MTDRQKYILQFLWRFGASRAEDIPMRSNGGPPSPAEVQSLYELGLIERLSMQETRRRDLVYHGEAYWQLTDAGIQHLRGEVA